MLTRDELIDAIGAIDADLVEDFVQTDERLQKKKDRRVSPLMRAVALAACFALILASVPALTHLWQEGPTPKPPKEVPVFENPLYTATELAELLAGDELKDNAVATNAYTTEEVPSADYLRIFPVPTEDYVTLYESHAYKQSLDRGEFSSLANRIFSKLSDALDTRFSAYSMERDESYDGSPYLLIRQESGPYWVSLTHRETWNSVNISSRVHTIDLGGVPVQVDQRMSDEDIIESLADTKERLFDIFGVRFEDAMVYRRYDTYSEYGVNFLTVYFYNRGDDPLHAYSYSPRSSYIALEFDNFMNYSGDVVSDTILSDVDIRYVQMREGDRSQFEPMSKAKRISLADAEALLYNGYVIGGHVCPLCMAMQTPVEFSGYDFVGFTYHTGYDKKNDRTVAIPFYTFYKRIGTGKNGNAIYAKTNVPAIEVSGFEEYVESQRKDHKTVATEPYP
ncbi:MAG: hypothetical protein E7605_08870 [Ruminococcaceae bacterium]|nr:hypothetical protein [Oscillospiraceae bacterium]